MTDYYHRHFDAYHAETFGIDPEPFLTPFIDRLHPDARVLDVGCGSGRDLLWLTRRGFEAVGFERSPGLAELATKSAGCQVVLGDFETHDFSGIDADALLMVGSLVHVPHERLAGVMRNILRALKREAISPAAGTDAETREGWLFVSLKEGVGRITDERGRVFSLWQDHELKAIFEQLSLTVRHFQRSLSADGLGKMWLGYVLSAERFPASNKA